MQKTVIVIFTLTVIGEFYLSHSFPLNQAIEVAGGIGDFINLIRSHLGRSSDFVTQHGFEYSNVYNSLLQYSVMNAFLQKRQNEIATAHLQHEKEEMESTHTNFIIGIIFLSLLSLLMMGNLITHIIDACRRN
jgi:hypothetical protein